ncbi:LexA family transcriptional regulator [bacterium]|nr:MAG: LexA family transcriptional regulator [bacterium]
MANGERGDIGRKLKEARDSFFPPMRQKDAIAKLNSLLSKEDAIKQTQMSAWERGEYNPPAAVVQAASKVYRKDLAFFAEPPLPPAAPKVAERLNVLAAYLGLAEEEWPKEFGIDADNPDPIAVRRLLTSLDIPSVWLIQSGPVPDHVPGDFVAAMGRSRDGSVTPVKASELPRGMRGLANPMATVALPVWRGTLAGRFDDECYWEGVEEPPEETYAWLISGGDPDNYRLVYPLGSSMSPRIIQGDRMIARLESDPAPGQIVLARREDGKMYVKVFRIGPEGLPELHSINERFPPIKMVEFPDSWHCRAVVIGIVKPPTVGPNIEFYGGTPLRG